MSSHGTKVGVIILGGFFVVGCVTPVPVATHALRCDVSEEILASQCDRPKQLPEDATYESVVDAMREDRQALLECGLKMEALKQSLVICRQQSEQFNKNIDEINDRNTLTAD